MRLRPAVCALVFVARVALAGVPAVVAQAADPSARLLLADFESPVAGPAGPIRWSGYRGERRDRIEVRVEAPADAPANRAARVGFTFAQGSRDSLPRKAEVGLRLDLGGIDARDFDHLALRVRGDSKAGFGPALKVQLRRPDPGRPERRESGSAIVAGITEEWREVRIPLGALTGIQTFTDLRELVVAVQSRRVGVERGAFWLDEIALVRTGEPGPSALDLVVPVRKKTWERKAGGEEAARRLVWQRLAGRPPRALAPGSALPDDDRELFQRVLRDTWRSLDGLRDRESGLPVDHVRLAGGEADAGARVGDFTNPTNVGLHVMALASAVELDLLARAEALARLDRLLGTLERLESWRGFLFNYYDTTSLERTSHFVSFVDSSWLAAGLMVARSAFPERSGRLSALLERGDWGAFYDPVEGYMSHGYWVNLDVPSEYHYGGLYSEARVGSLVAIGSGDVPASHWRELLASFPTGKSRIPWRRPRGVWRWGGIDYVPSWGGSMFEALMPVLVVDEPGLAPGTLGRNDAAHVAIQRRFALEELGYTIWGLSPCATPGTDTYGERGVPVLGAAGYPPGVVAPYASALAAMLEPAAAAANLRRLARDHPMYGEWGFLDAVDPASGEAAQEYLVLDQAMTFLALANLVGDGVVQRHFAADAIARRALPLLSDARPEP